MGAKTLNFEKLDENQNLNEFVREAVQSAFDIIDDKFETYAKNIEEVECRSRDGFISGNDGGWSAFSFVDIDTIYGMGTQNRFNDVVREKLDSLYEEGLKDALEAFVSKNKEELKRLRIPKKKINYHDLYELKQSKLAEELSELEREHTGGEQSSVMLQLEAFLNFEHEGDSKRSIHISCAVNWEAPYHRRGKNREWFAQEDIEFDSEEDLRRKLPKALKKIASKALA